MLLVWVLILCWVLGWSSRESGGVILSSTSRNPDKDERPWCYVVKDNALSWEYCRLAACGAGTLRGWGQSMGGAPLEPSEGDRWRGLSGAL